jgi:hypothetical protein
MREVIDAALFMGMHCDDEPIRLACKAFFVERLDGSVLMSQEQVGRCDALVWTYGRADQDAYYPFMDNLHTVLRIDRPAYTEDDVRTALDEPALKDLPMPERLLMGMVLATGSVLRTPNPRLAARTDLPVRPLPAAGETAFPAPLERMYGESLALRVPTDFLEER